MKYTHRKRVICILGLIIISGAIYLAICEYKRITEVVKNIPFTCEQGLITTKSKFDEFKKEYKLTCQTLDEAYLCSNEDFKICVIVIIGDQVIDSDDAFINRVLKQNPYINIK